MDEQSIKLTMEIAELRENSRRGREENPLFEEPDRVTAEYLNRRLSELERKKRRKTREDGLLPPKPIDILDPG